MRSGREINSVAVVINDRLSYQSVRWGSMSDWPRAAGTIESRDDKSITYNFNVPVYGDDYPPDQVQIEYQYVADKGWKINSPTRLLN
jgi:hypothetical protein